MERVYDHRAARTGQGDEIIAEAEEIMEMDDVGTKLAENRPKAPSEKVVRPVCQADVFPAVDAMIGGQAVDGLASQSPPPVARDVREVEDPDVVGPGQLAREVVAVHLRPLGGVRRELVDDLEDSQV